MYYEIIAFLILVVYIAIGVFIDAIIVSIDKYGDNLHGLIIFLWPILAIIAAALLVIVIIPSALGEMIVHFIKKKIKD